MPKKINLFNNDDIYKHRIIELRQSKLISTSDFDLRKKLTKSEKRKINYRINKYDNILALKSQNRMAVKYVKNKKTQELFRKKGYLVKNNRVYIQKTKNQKVKFSKDKNNNVSVIKVVGKKVVKVKFTQLNILQQLKKLRLKPRQALQLNYYGYGMAEQYETVEECIEGLMAYLENENYSKSTLARKKTLLARYSYSVTSY